MKNKKEINLLMILDTGPANPEINDDIPRAIKLFS